MTDFLYNFTVWTHVNTTSSYFQISEWALYFLWAPSEFFPMRRSVKKKKKKKKKGWRNRRQWELGPPRPEQQTEEEWGSSSINHPPCFWVVLFFFPLFCFFNNAEASFTSKKKKQLYFSSWTPAEGSCTMKWSKKCPPWLQNNAPTPPQKPQKLFCHIQTKKEKATQGAGLMPAGCDVTNLPGIFESFERSWGLSGCCSTKNSPSAGSGQLGGGGRSHIQPQLE